MRELATDILILGSGGAGLFAANNALTVAPKPASANEAPAAAASGAASAMQPATSPTSGEIGPRRSGSSGRYSGIRSSRAR